MEYNEIIFWKVIKNRVLINNIFSFINERGGLKSTLLPKLIIGDKHPQKIGLFKRDIYKIDSHYYFGDYVEPFEENIGDKCYFKYDEIKMVSRLLKYNTELLRYKVSRGDLLIFEDNDIHVGSGLFSKFKDQLLDYSFYLNLFKNYSNYIISTSTLVTCSKIKCIIKCDCLVALLALLSTVPHHITFTILDYIESISIGSTQISNYFDETYNFKTHFKSDSELVNKLFLCCLDNYGAKEEDIHEKNKTFKYLSSIGITVPDHIGKKVGSIIDFQIQDKSLQFILDTCYSISYLEPLILESFKFNQTFFNNFIDKKDLNGDYTLPISKILSKCQLNEIEKSFTQQKLSSKIQDLDTRDEIKQLVLMSILYSSDISKIETGRYTIPNIYFYLYKNETHIYNKTNSRMDSLNHSIYRFRATQLIQPFHSPLCGNEVYRDQLFKYCKNDSTKQLSFIKCFINDVLNQGENQNYYIGEIDLKGIKKQQFLASLFKLIIQFGNFKYMEMIIDQISKNEQGIKFLNPLSSIHGNLGLFGFCSNVEIFDLLYSNQYTKQHFQIGTLFEYCYHHHANGKASAIKILNHFKLNYPDDYYKSIDSHYFPNRYFCCEFIWLNFSDFTDTFFMKNNNFFDYYLTHTGRASNLVPESLPLSVFLHFFHLKKESQKYSTMYNPEILAWVIENRKQDLESTLCILPTVTTMFNYLIYSNQLSKALDVNSYILKTSNDIHVRTTISNSNQLSISNLLILTNTISNIINNFNTDTDGDLDILISYINNKTFVNDIKSKMIFQITKNNNLQVLEYIYIKYPSFFTSDGFNMLPNYTDCSQ